MSKIKIVRELKKKGLYADIEYIRNEPTPNGYACGWDIIFTDESYDKLKQIGFDGVYESDCLNMSEVIEYLNTLPDCS